MFEKWKMGQSSLMVGVLFMMVSIWQTFDLALKLCRFVDDSKAYSV